MLKAFKYKLNPNEDQIVLINKHIGASRFIYNLALETKQIAYAGNKTNLSCFELHKQLTDLKEELPWLKELNSQSLQQAITNLDKAYTLFFKGQNSFPKFKKKSNIGSFNIPQNVKIENNKLIIPKFTKKNGINIILHRPLIGEIRQATISKTASGKYFVSILCETGEINKLKQNIKEDKTIGIDLGIKNFLITSNEDKFDNPRYLKTSLSKLKFLQKKYSKYKGKKTKQKIAKLHEKIVNQRKDNLHKISTKLIRENQSIALENLNVSGMMKNHNLAQSISDVSWSSFVSMLEYKADWYGVNLLKIGRFDPSSKTCSCCGNINKNLKLNDREWKCTTCNTTHDRDINAAKNIKNFALRNNLSGTDRKNHDELPTLVGVMTHEAHKTSGSPNTSNKF
jgi:putative transposase